MCIKKKLKNKMAFTLAETLVAILIMLMVSSIMVTGIPAAKNAYEKVFIRSNAEIAMSTAIYALRNELSGARNVKVNGTTVTYTNPIYGSNSIISIGKEGIMYQRYAAVGDEEAVKKEERLVSEAASDGFIVKYNEVVKTDDYVTFKNLNVYDSDKKKKLSDRDLSITTY